MSADTVAAQIDVLRQRFVERAASDLEALRRHLTTPAQDSSAEAIRLAHRLAGSAGTFGFDQLSQLAFDLEQRLDKGTTPLDLLDGLETALAEI